MVRGEGCQLQVVRALPGSDGQGLPAACLAVGPAALGRHGGPAVPRPGAPAARRPRGRGRRRPRCPARRRRRQPRPEAGPAPHRQSCPRRGAEGPPGQLTALSPPRPRRRAARWRADVGKCPPGSLPGRRRARRGRRRQKGAAFSRRLCAPCVYSGSTGRSAGPLAPAPCAPCRSQCERKDQQPVDHAAGHRLRQ